MKPVCVLGNGQLGRMLRQAGEPMGIAVHPVGLDADPAALPIAGSVITAEIERWPETALTRELASHPAFVNRDIFPRLADRLTQKQLLDQLSLATAPGNCWRIKVNGRTFSKRWANWLLLSAARAVMTVVANGGYVPVKPIRYPTTVMVNALSNKALTSRGSVAGRRARP